ncbi:hypothetical protein TL16_g04410 [Triparma laevis f. inornata]|uniref:Uncharacterized protein n=1 Tax=Triparma laevis f. inornata TaxID=1714386 RepID=A0A9W7A5M5_9STRA|nr:hypothetical protein TL16_g04410 [Triparma laevis f. inornata]
MLSPLQFLLAYPSLTFVIACGVAIVGGAFIVDEISKQTEEWYWSNNPNAGRCEETSGNEANFLREPANAVSNTVFILVGIYAFVACIYDLRHFRKSGCSFPLLPKSDTEMGGMVHSPLLSLAYAFSMSFGGYGSFYYHACSGCPSGGTLDIWSIFVMCIAVAVLLVIWTYGCLVLSGRKQVFKEIWSLTCVITWASLCWYCKDWQEPPIWQGTWEEMYRLLLIFLGGTAAMAFLLLALLIFLKVKTQWIVFVPASIASVTMGVGAWFPEEFNEDCVDVFGGEFGEGRQSFFQLHALWHSMLALCMLSLYMFIRGLAVEQITLDKCVGKDGLKVIDFHLLREVRGEGEWAERMTSVVRTRGEWEWEWVGVGWR